MLYMFVKYYHHIFVGKLTSILFKTVKHYLFKINKWYNLNHKINVPIII